MDTWMQTVEIRGMAGLTFLLLVLSGYLYLLGFASSAWDRVTHGNRWEQYGLWESCSCVKSNDVVTMQDWFVASQAFITIGLIGLAGCIALAALYMCVGRVRRSLSLILLTVACISTTLMMFLGIVIFGAEATNPHWGFAMAVLAMCCTAGACIMSVIMLRNDELCCFEKK